MFDVIGDVAAGGWNAVDNIITGIGQGVSRIGSTFFPATQRTRVVSEITKPAPNQGDIFRQTAAENRSMLETYAMAANQWLNTPYEAQFAVPIKVQESQKLAAGVSGFVGPPEPPRGMLADIMQLGKKFAEVSGEIRTVASDIAEAWGFRSPISEGPAEIGASRGQVSPTQPPQTAGADIITGIRGLMGGLADQAKGLYNLAFPQQGAQPAFAVQHEITPSKGLSAGLIIAGIVLVIVILFMKKK